MKIFKILFICACRYYLDFLDFFVFSFLFFRNFFFIFMFFFMFAFCFLFFFISVIEFSFFSLLFLLFDFKPMSIFFPYVYLQRFRSYFDFIVDSFSFSQGLASEDFFPPFNFGHREPFRARIVGWPGTWASFLGRWWWILKTRSNVYDWGFKSNFPQEPGTREIRVYTEFFTVPDIYPRTFKNLTGLRYDDYIWFYSFPPLTLTPYGYKDDFWDDDNFMWYATLSEEFLALIAWDLRDTVDFYNEGLDFWNLWLQIWAPSLNPSYLRSRQFSSIDYNSPYSYFNFYPTYYNSQYVDFKKGSLTNTTIGAVYTQILQQHEIKPSLFLKKFDSKKNFDPAEVVGWIDYSRQKVEDDEPAMHKVDEKGVAIADYTVAYRVLKSTPYTDQSGSISFNYLDYLRLNVYHTFLEFSTIIFESFYIFPFEFKMITFDFFIEDSNHRSWSLKLFESFFEVFNFLDFGPFYFIVVLIALYFIIFVLFTHVLKFLLLKINNFFYSKEYLIKFLLYIYIYTYL